MSPLRFSLGSLKARMALVLGLVLVPPAAYAMLQTTAVYRAQASRELAMIQATADRVSGYQRDALQRSQDFLEEVARSLVDQLADPAGCSALLTKALVRTQELSGLLVATPAGMSVCGSSTTLVGLDLSDREWFMATKREGGFVVSDVVESRLNPGRRTVILALPFEGASGDVLAGSLVLSTFAGITDKAMLPPGGVAYLIDRRGQPLNAVDPATMTLPNARDTAQLLLHQNAAQTVSGPSGRMQFVVAPVAPGRMYVLIGLPSPRWSWLERDLVLGLIAPVLMLALAVICIWIATDYLVNRHIQILASAARAYAARRLPSWPSMHDAPTELKDLAAVLAQTTRELENHEAELQASLAQKERLVREIHHRVKNNLQVVTSLLNLRAQNLPSREARFAMLEAQNRIKTLALVHRALDEGDELAGVELQSLLRELCHFLEDGIPREGGRIQVSTRLDRARISLDKAVPIALLVTEALSNAFRHAFAHGRGGEVELGLARLGDRARLWVEDNGVGLAKEATGLGLTLIRMLAVQVGGEVRIDRGQGTRIELSFPVLAATDEGGTA